ncbi:MAG: tyrosine--tRNA ligase, partial [Candidatus Taylorbacteria bacterium]
MELNNKLEEIEELFSRGVAEFIDPEGKFKEKLIKKTKGENSGNIVIKFGVDPTRPDIHLGHAVVLRKLRKFQDLGCKVIFLVGDFTATIGDPSGKSKVRPEIEQAEVEKNVKSFLDQVGKILTLDTSVFSWIRNSDWFYGVTDLEPKNAVRVFFQTTLVNPKSFIGKSILFSQTRMQKTHLKSKEIVSVSLKGLLWTLKHISFNRLVERDMFQERIKRGEELFMHEMMYPVLQGIDSFVLGEIFGSCDLEIGGTDQTFNMLTGRDVMRVNRRPQQAVLTVRILEGTDGKEKMSKSMENFIGITDSPSDMYGKIMSIPDSSIINYFTLCTYTPLSAIEETKKELENGKGNPKNVKMKLARETVAIYHGEDKASKALEDFRKTFEKGEMPEDVPEIQAKAGDELSSLLLESGFVESK